MTGPSAPPQRRCISCGEVRPLNWDDACESCDARLRRYAIALAELRRWKRYPAVDAGAFR